jgi:hypothetical protein
MLESETTAIKFICLVPVGVAPMGIVKLVVVIVPTIGVNSVWFDAGIIANVFFQAPRQVTVKVAPDWETVKPLPATTAALSEPSTETLPAITVASGKTPRIGYLESLLDI